GTEPATSAPSGLAGFNLEDLAQQAARRLQGCQQEMDRLRAEAAAEIETLRCRAHAEGFAAGRAEAACRAESELKTAVESRIAEHGVAVQSMVQQIAQRHEQWMQQYADSLVALVIAVSQRVIRGR